MDILSRCEKLHGSHIMGFEVTQPWMGGNLRRRWKLPEDSDRADAQFPSEV